MPTTTEKLDNANYQKVTTIIYEVGSYNRKLCKVFTEEEAIKEFANIRQKYGAAYIDRKTITTITINSKERIKEITERCFKQ